MGLMRKLTAAVAAASLVVSLVGTAMAADITPDAGKVAGEKMIQLGLLTGRPGDDKLALNESITRAELMTIMVRAYGQEANAKLLAGAPVFTDTAKHWASGYIAMAKAVIVDQNKMEMGLPDGSFAPDDKVTPAQAVAFLMKFLGIQRDTTKSWPADYLDKAVAAGLITADNKAAITPTLNTNATRGFIFALFDASFSTYKFADGKTFYTKFVDTTAPVLTVNKPAAATTMDSSLTVSGTVKGAISLKVAGTAVALTGESFSTTVALNELKAYDIPVEAMDLAGNVATDSVKITRTVGTATTIDAKDITVAAGATVDAAAAVKDAKGNVISGVAVTGESTVGTFADGKFTANTTAGAGTLKLTAGELTATVNVTVTAGALAKVEAAGSVKPGTTTVLAAKDAYGNTVTGVTFSQSSADALLDASTGTFIASKAGQYTVKATKDGVTVEGTVGVYGDVAKVVVSGPATVVANNSSEYKLTLKAVDKNGNVVTDYDGNFQVESTDFNDADGVAIADNTEYTAEDGVKEITVQAPGNLGGADVVMNVEALDGDTDSFDPVAKGEFIAEGIAQVPTALKVEAPDYIDVGTATNADVKVTVRDQDGKVMLGTESWSTKLTITGPAVWVLEDDKEMTKAVASGSAGTTFEIVREEVGETGNVVITATFTGLTTGTDTVKAVVAQDPAKVKVIAVTDEAIAAGDATDDGEFHLKVQVTDKSGVPVAYTGDVDVTLTGVTDDNDEEISYDVEDDEDNLDPASLLSGVDDQTFTVSFAGVSEMFVGLSAAEFVGDITATAKNDDLANSGTAVATFKAGDAAGIEFVRDDSIDVALSSPSADLKIQLVDAAGNPVKKAGEKIELEVTAGTESRVAFDTTEPKTDANGIATAKATFKAYTGDYTLTATWDDTETDTLVVSVKNTVTDSMSVGLYREAASSARVTTVEAGSNVYLRVTLKDNLGSIIETAAAYEALTVETPDADEHDSVDLDALVWEDVTNADGEIIAYEAAVQTMEAGTFTLKVTDESTAKTITSSKSVSVTAKVPAGIEIKEADDNALKVTENNVKAFTVQVVDEYGNVVAPNKVAFPVVITWDTDDAANVGVGEIEIRHSEKGGAQATSTISAGNNTKTIYVYAEQVDGASHSFMLNATVVYDKPAPAADEPLTALTAIEVTVEDE